jgi:hypothetical protein
MSSSSGGGCLGCGFVCCINWKGWNGVRGAWASKFICSEKNIQSFHMGNAVKGVMFGCYFKMCNYYLDSLKNNWPFELDSPV